MLLSDLFNCSDNSLDEEFTENNSLFNCNSSKAKYNSYILARKLSCSESNIFILSPTEIYFSYIQEYLQDKLQVFPLKQIIDL